MEILGHSAPGREQASRRSWYIAAWLTIGLSLLKTLRLPNSYASTHHVLDYRYGLIRRGLVGELARRVGSPWLYTHAWVSTLSFAVLALELWLLWRAVKDLIDTRDARLSALTLVYTSSLALVYAAHTVGYFDHLGLVFALVALRLDSFGRKLAWIACAGTPLLFVHEATLVLFVPLAAFSALASLDELRLDRRTGALAAVLLVQCVITYLIASRGMLTAEQAFAMRQAVLPKIDFEFDDTVFDSIVRSQDGGTVGKTLSSLGRGPYLLANFDSLMIVAPSLITLLVVALRTCRAAGFSRWLRLAAGLGALSPLLMHFLGSDMHRWDAIALTTTFLVLHAAALRWPRERPAADSGSDGTTADLPWMLALVAINASSMTFLFDGEHVRQYPFFELRHALFELLRR